MTLSIRRLLSGSANRPTVIAASVVAIGLVVLLGALGWRWFAGGTLQSIRVSGTAVLAPDSVRTLSTLRIGQPLHEVDPGRTANRLHRHPWISESQVRVQPFRNQVDVRVEERTPKGRWVAPNGTPRFFLDAAGHALPARTDTTFDAPLVYDDSVSYHATEPVVRPATQQALRALSDTDTVRAIISGFRTDPDHTVRLYVTHPQGYTMTVQLGKSDYRSKLRRLEAFYTHVLPHMSEPVRTIDLRFENQIITQP